MNYCVTVTNHGVHEFDLDAGAPDTGGQNVFVNQMSRGLVDLEWDVTIFNRGGYPHPRTGVTRRGTLVAPPPYHDTLRTVLLEDGERTFVRKEAMAALVEPLAESLTAHLREMIANGRTPLLVVSHYWDGGCIAAAACRRLWPGGDGPFHAWVPHSLGTVKRRNMPREQWAALNLDEREHYERVLLSGSGPLVVGATSAVIENSLVEDYGYRGTVVFLPPCIETERFHPGSGDVDSDAAQLLAEHSPLSVDRIRRMRILTEISRTDRTKRKDLIVEVFRRLARGIPDILLAITIDDRQKDVAGELRRQIEESGVAERVVVLGNVAPRVPALLRSTYLYITPSEMEGFGMSIQEAAACGVPAVTSDLVPFAVEYLADRGARVVPHGDIDAFTAAAKTLLQDRSVRDRMGRAAHAITVPEFTWRQTLHRFLRACRMESVSGLSRERAAELQVSGSLTDVARQLAAEGDYRPEGRCVTDPRDGTRILYNAARARRPHDNRPLEDRAPVAPAAPAAPGPGENCVVCAGQTTPIIDIASLSRGFTFVNFNLYPMVVPEGASPGEDETVAEGLHLLQWTSSIHDQDWQTLSSPDRLVVMQRLAALEKLLVEEGRYVTIIKNYGHLVGGSLVHGHQQIAATNVLPARSERNHRYREEAGETASRTLGNLMEDRHLSLRRFSSGTLGIAPWMRRPYEMVYTVHDDGPRNLFELNDTQLQDLGDALGVATGAMMELFPRIGKEPAYNILFNTGPGAGIYLEFLPYTQETGGFEHAGLYVCQATPELCHNVYDSIILPGRWR